MIKEGEIYQGDSQNCGFYLRVDRLWQERKGLFRVNTLAAVSFRLPTERISTLSPLWNTQWRTDTEGGGVLIFHNQKEINKFLQGWSPIPKLTKVILGL